MNQRYGSFGVYGLNEFGGTSEAGGFGGAIGSDE